MAQTQFWFQSWANNWMWSWINQFWNFQTKQTGVSNVKTNTYNSRYPWFDEEDMKKLESMVADIQDPSERQDTMDYLYRAFYDTVQNEHKLKERNWMLNQQTYEIGNINNTDQKNQAQTKLKLSELAQQIKSTYHINANVDDGEVLNSFIEQTPNWQELLQNYINNWDNELLYVWWLQQRPQQTQWWWARSLINNPNEQNMFWDKETTAWNVLDMMNLIWEWAEDIDNIVNRYLPTITWEKAVNNLADRINNLSDEEIAQLRQQYNNMINSMEEDDRYTAWEIAWDFLRTLWHWTVWDKEKAQQAATRLTQAVKKEWGRWYEISREAALDDESFKKWLIDNQATFGEYMIWANETLQWINSPNVVKFFSNIPWSAVKTFTATVRWMTNPYDTLSWLVKLIGTEEWHQALKARYGSWDAIANTMNTDPVWFADDIASIANMVWWATQKLWKLTWSTKITNAWNWMNANIWSATDALAWKTVWWIYKWIDNNLINSSNKLVSNAWKYMEATSNLWKSIEYGKEWLNYVKEKVWKPLSNFAEEVIDKTVWINKEDRQFIRENWELVDQYLDWTKTVDDTLKDVEKAIKDAQKENSKIWQEYDKLRASDEKAYTKWLKDDLSEWLSKKWITIDENWDLVFDKFSKYNDSQKNALKKAWWIVKDAEWAEYLSADQILNLRQKFDDAINRENKSLKGSAVDKDAEWLIKSFREAIDTRAKTDIEWLRVLDERYWDSISELKKIQKDRFNSDWTLKDNARSKLRNLTRAWNEEKLARLEKVAPWITQQLRALDVWLTVNKATQQNVWQYVKWWLIGWWLFATLSNPWLWIPAALVWVLATPKNFVRLIERMPDIWEKIKLWQALSNIEIQKLSDFASELQNEAARVVKTSDYEI